MVHRKNRKEKSERRSHKKGVKSSLGNNLMLIENIVRLK